MGCALVELALKAPPHVALAAGLGIAGIVSPDPREKKKNRTGLIPCKGIFLKCVLYRSTTEANSFQLFVLLPRRGYSLSQEGKKKFQNHE